MDTLIYIVMSNPTVVLLVAGFLAAVVAMARKPDGFTFANVAEELLAYFVLFSVGLNYLYNFVMHAFYGEMVASFIGWADSPFQLEVAYASLGFAAVGFFAFKSTLAVRFAAILGPAMFEWGAAGGHIYQIFTAHNFAPGNAGGVLYTDIFLPVIGFALVWLKWRSTLPSSGMKFAPTRAPTNLAR
jgi:Family of unknown function (DUF6790)